jgi:hypothetical protein
MRSKRRCWHCVSLFQLQQPDAKEKQLSGMNARKARDVPAMP